ncbi:hypothetical protein NC651_002633 [Populus alba x Populus x berolinensis]|nr:hypothetical protein NC651_002633 [Populus alba x Populus x berolinensis]
MSTCTEEGKDNIKLLFAKETDCFLCSSGFGALLLLCNSRCISLNVCL